MKMIALMTVVVCFLWSREAVALVDQGKFQQFVRVELQKVLDGISQNGTAPVRYPFVSSYDTNKDGVIDETEAPPIRAFLGVNQKQISAANETPPVTQVQAESKPKVKPEEKPKSGWFRF